MLTAFSGSSSLFKRRRFDSSIIILCVRCYITYKLSYRELRDMMAERGVSIAHTTILRWVQSYVPDDVIVCDLSRVDLDLEGKEAFNACAAGAPSSIQDLFVSEATG
jgi:hypothetical protein